MSQFNSFQSGFKNFDDPFLLYSNQYFPENLASALEFCKYLYFLVPSYRKASQRVARHFITEFNFPGDGDATEKEEFRDFIYNTLRLPALLTEMGDEWSCYGNAFYRPVYPFDRFLVDRRDGKFTTYPLSNFAEDQIKFDMATLKYKVKDPRSTAAAKDIKTITLDFMDLKSTDKSRFKIKKMNPQQCSLQYSHWDSSFQLLYRFESAFVQSIQKGDLWQVNTTPKEILEAVRDKKDFKFKQGEVFHFRAPVISGISDHGWGMPEIIANFRSIHQYQVYRKIDEAVGEDYMLPFRVMSPEGNVGDASNNLSMKQWAHNAKSMINVRRKDKTAIHAFPLPIKYDEFGGQGKNLTPKELMEFHKEELFDGAGYPIELFRASLQVQQVPTAVRLFENAHWFLFENYNTFSKWAIKKASNYFDMEEMEIELQRPSIADNIDKQNVLLQLGMQGELPRSTYMPNFGITNPEEAIEQRLEEDLNIEKKRMEMEEEYARSMENSVNAEAAGGGQEGGAGGGGTTPMDVEDEAMQKATEWLAMEEGERRKAMDVVRTQDIHLYSMAKEFMEQQRRQAGSEGRANFNEQAKGGGQPPPQ